jgi:hypothetical protein
MAIRSNGGHVSASGQSRVAADGIAWAAEATKAARNGGHQSIFRLAAMPGPPQRASRETACHPSALACLKAKDLGYPHELKMELTTYIGLGT